MEKIPERYINLAKIMGFNVESLPQEEKSYAFVKAMKKLKEECGEKKN
ncbi:MAG: hypothetical protein ABDH25_04695 [Dictyoglomaceae bacterium]